MSKCGWGQPPLHCHTPWRPEFWEQCGEEADERQIRADVEDEGDAVVIGDFAEKGGAEAAEAEGGAEEEAGHRPDFAGDEFLRVNEDGGEG
jgi:hypothetical protein